jgi:ArsR family transcriptional regulator, cadmium/lead-responsive transcriptional repressor
MSKTLRAPIQAFQHQAKLFRGFSDQSRLTILETLRYGSLPVGEIAKAAGLTQPNVSNHLKCLSECGLVLGEQKGRFVHYRLGDDRVGQMLQLADELLAGNARRIRQCVNYPDESGDGTERLTEGGRWGNEAPRGHQMVRGR